MDDRDKTYTQDELTVTDEWLKDKWGNIIDKAGKKFVEELEKSFSNESEQEQENEI